MRKSYPQLRHPYLLRRFSLQSRTRWPISPQLPHLISTLSHSARSCLQWRAVWPISGIQSASPTPLRKSRVEYTSAVSALENLPIIRESRIGQALEIVIRIRGPSIPKGLSRRLRTVEEADNVLAVQAALEVNQADDIEGFLLLLWK